MRWVLVWVLGLGLGAAQNETVPHQIRLVKDLLDPTRYNSDVRPVKDNKTPIDVTIRMNLYQVTLLASLGLWAWGVLEILDVNEPNQNIVLYVWVTQTWDDEFLGWDPADYGGISFIVLPYNRIWLPDTYLYNSLEMTRESVERFISVILEPKPVKPKLLDSERLEKTWARNDSTPAIRASIQQEPPVKWRSFITFRYPAIYTYSCRMYILYFPFDIQNCTMTFGSWTYDNQGINFYAKNERVLNESFIQNEEWDVLSFNTQRQVLQYACCPNPFVLIKMHLVIQRKPLYFIVNLVIPTSIITAVAVIGFFMPSSSDGVRAEKDSVNQFDIMETGSYHILLMMSQVNLGITTLLAMSILLLMVTDNMPTTRALTNLALAFFSLTRQICLHMARFGHKVVLEPKNIRNDFVPLIGWYFLTIIILVSTGTALTSFIILLQQQGRNGRKLPKIMKRVIFDFVAPCLLVSLPDELKKKGRETKAKTAASTLNSTYDLANDNQAGLNESFGMEPLLNKTQVSPDGRGNHVLSDSHTRLRALTGFDDFGHTTPPLPDPAMKATLERILSALNHMKGRAEEEAAGAGLELEWEFVCAVLDRLFLLIFMAGILVVTFAFISLGIVTEQSAYVRDRQI